MPPVRPHGRLIEDPPQPPVSQGPVRAAPAYGKEGRPGRAGAPRTRRTEVAPGPPAQLPRQSHAAPHPERRAAGTALRERVPRDALARWQPDARRADPVALLVASSAGRVPELLPIRYGRMMASPFAFFRGAASVMAHDRPSPRRPACRSWPAATATC
ncbi:MAG: DUF2252 family protein [Pseudomonadota bacterium]